jgi:curved DNA-binding protein CbpA
MAEQSNYKSNIDSDSDNIDDIIGEITKNKNKPSSPEHKQEKCKDTSEQLNDYIDYYKIIGANKTDDMTVIKKKCNKKLQEYHPDTHKLRIKNENISSDNIKATVEKWTKQYKMIVLAHKILTNENKRKYYDLQIKTKDNNNIQKTKNDFEEYKRLQESVLTDTSKANAESQFKMDMIQMDAKHNFDRVKYNNEDKTKLCFNDIQRRIDDLQLNRDQEEIEFQKDNKFEGRKFNNIEFQTNWEKEQKNKKKQAKTNKSIVTWDNIGTYGDYGETGTNYVSINTDYGGLYTEEYTDQFAQKLDSDEEDSVSSQEISTIDISYVEQPKNKADLQAEFDKKMAQRENETKLYDSRKRTDKSWQSVMANPISISAQIGFDIDQKPIISKK